MSILPELLHCFCFRAQVDVLATLASQALGFDRFEKSSCRTVIEDFRRLDVLKGEIDGDRMSLTGADFGTLPIKGKSLFFISRDHFIEERSIDVGALTTGAL
jgi:hypothetical protein